MDDPSKESLAIGLMGMGFDETIVRQAVATPGVIDAETAINFILSSAEEEGDGEEEEVEDLGEPAKMVIVVRSDLNMSPGKIAAQCVHAALRAVKLSNQAFVRTWESQGEPVIALAIEDDAKLEAILLQAVNAGLVVGVQHDAGRTEVEPDTRTCAAIGPALNSKINAITGRLRLLK
jgi:PTH2 family peptidyl-tRNA hydrolase